MVYNQNQAIDILSPSRKRHMTNDILQQKLLILMSAIQRSDEKAFAEFYDLTVNRVYGLVFKILANKLDSEEVVCDVFTQLWQQAGKYHAERGSIMGWCMLIARCRALDLYRKRRNKNEILRDASEYIDDFSDDMDEPDKLVQAFTEDSNTRLRLALLSSTQRQLIALAFFKGLSHSEISQAIDMPLGSVKSNIRRALEALQQSIRS